MNHPGTPERSNIEPNGERVPPPPPGEFSAKVRERYLALLKIGQGDRGGKPFPYFLNSKEEAAYFTGFTEAAA